MEAIQNVKQCDPDSVCPWYTFNRLDNVCICKEYTNGYISLISVDKNCIEHGCEEIVDKTSQVV